MWTSSETMGEYPITLSALEQSKVLVLVNDWSVEAVTKGLEVLHERTFSRKNLATSARAKTILTGRWMLGLKKDSTQKWKHNIAKYFQNKTKHFKFYS